MNATQLQTISFGACVRKVIFAPENWIDKVVVDYVASLPQPADMTSQWGTRADRGREEECQVFSTDT